MAEFQVKKSNLNDSRLVDTAIPKATDDGIVVRVDSFAFTSNNLTYGVAGDQLGYWQFFPPVNNDGSTWGILPVWGYAEVIESNCSDINQGERIFGYFPPSDHLLMQPANIKNTGFMESSAHRASLPPAYNRYRRLSQDPAVGSNAVKHQEDLQALLFPLYITSFCLWDSLSLNNWHNAEQVIVLSASSKTSIGLGYALALDDNAPKTLGVTSERHYNKLQGLNIYNKCTTYDKTATIDNVPSVIVDMSGNSDVLGRLHTVLGDNMKHTLNVGITHWQQPRTKDGIIKERCELFFAPSHIQLRIQEWGPAEFELRSSAFMKAAFNNSSRWLHIDKLNGLKDLKSIYPKVCNGDIPPDSGIVINMSTP